MTNQVEEANIRSDAFAPSLRSAPGGSPGAFVVDPDAERTSIELVAYGPDHVAESTVSAPADLELPNPDGCTVRWIQVTGLRNADQLRLIGAHVGMHRLALEDTVNAYQRPKTEDYDDATYVIAHHPTGVGIETQQVSLYLVEGTLLMFLERPAPCLEPVLSRIRSGKGKIRKCGADYLAYAVLDAITDSFFPILESMGESLDTLEDAALANPTVDTLVEIREAKKQLLLLRRTIWPMRELFNALMRSDTPHISETTRPYLRDCYDHVAQLVDITENYRELCSGLTDIYMSMTGNRMNEIMKVLTIVATIFIPLTFVAGIYGMNFNPEKGAWNMPELSWEYGYLACWGVMVALGLGMVIYFRRLGWLGTRS